MVEVHEQRCRDSFIAWLDLNGHSMNPEGFGYAFEHQNDLNESEFQGMNMWLNDFREMFAEK